MFHMNIDLDPAMTTKINIFNFSLAFIHFGYIAFDQATFSKVVNNILRNLVTLEGGSSFSR